MDQHLAALWVSQWDFTLSFQQTLFKGQRLQGRYVKKSVKNIFANSSEPDMQTFAVEFVAGTDIVSTPFPALCQIPIKFVDDLKLDKS